MKKLLIISLLFFIQFESKSQEDWSFAPIAGFNLVPINEEGAAGITYRPGLHFSLLASQKIEERWSFQYSIGVNRRYLAYSNSREDQDIEDLLNGLNNPLVDTLISGVNLTTYTDVQGSSEFWTFDIPVTATYEFKSGFQLFAGGFVNYLLSTQNTEVTTTHVPVTEVLDLSNFVDPTILALIPENETVTNINETDANMNEINYGAIGGLGYRSEKILLRLSVHYGFRDIRSDNSRVKINNIQAVQLSIGYLFYDLFETSGQQPKYDLDLIE